MLVEIRRYTIKEGRRAEFVSFFESEVAPAMRRCGMKILGAFVGIDDPDSFFYLREFDSEQQRSEQYAAFYDGDAWLGGMRDRAMEMEESYVVELVRRVDAT